MLTLLDIRTNHNKQKIDDALVWDKPSLCGSKLTFKIYDDFVRCFVSPITEDNIFAEANNIKKERKVRERTEEQEKEDKLRSGKRSYQAVVEKCMLIKADRMITLTFKENITSKSLAYKSLQSFIRLMRVRFKKFEYVCVPEKQKRGAIHYHIATNTYYLWSTILTLWRKSVAIISKETGGIFINSKASDRYKKSGSNGVGKYIAKYISKSFTEGNKNEKRYYTSKMVNRPTAIKCYSLIKTTDIDDYGVLDRFINAITDKRVDFSGKKCVQFKMWNGDDAIMVESNLISEELYQRKIKRKKYEHKEFFAHVERLAATRA